MNAQPQTEAVKPKAPDVVPHRRLSVVYFNRSVVLCGSETESASVPSKTEAMGGHRPGNSVDSIELAWLSGDGLALGQDDKAREAGPSDGLVFRKRAHDSAKNQRISAQTFVPWANVRCMSYGAE